MRRQPKTKLEEFREQLDKAQTKEEIKNILGKIETYAKIHQTEEGFILLAIAYYKLGDIEKALQTIEPLTSLQAKYIEIILDIAAGKFSSAYNLIKEIEKKADKDMKENLNLQKFLIYTSIGEIDKAEQLFTPELKKKLIERNPLTAMEIIPQIEGYRKAKELISKDNKLKEALEELKEILKKYFEQFKINPIIEKDPEFSTEELWINIILPKDTSKEKIDEAEGKIISEIILKKGIDINYLFIKPAEYQEVELVYT